MKNISNRQGSKRLLIAVIQKDDEVLMRKKPGGSAPYKETWYLFGCEPQEGQEDILTLTEYVKTTLGVGIHSVVPVGEDTETKLDNGIAKKFIYSDFDCIYKSGIPKIPPGAERVEWIPKEKLSEYDITPPSKKLLKKMGLMA